MAVVNTRILELSTRRRVESDALGRDSLPRRQGIRAGFEGVSRRHQLFCQHIHAHENETQGEVKERKGKRYITIRLSNIRKRIRIPQRLHTGIQRPPRNMHLLPQRHRISLHERIHILPAIQLSHAADLRAHHGLGGIPRPVTED